MTSRKLVVVALVMSVAACGELVAPGRSAPNAANAFGGVTTDLSATDTTRFSISIDPWRSTTYYLGAGNSVMFPAGSICNPNTSTFGLTEWNRPCDAARYPVRVNVRAWLDATGHARVDFTPHLRFVPSVLPAGWVNISFGDVAGSQHAWHNILYCGTATRSCVDESAADPSLRITWDPVTGKTARRIKHLSGYLAASGSDSGSTPNSVNRIGAGAPSAFGQQDWRWRPIGHTAAESGFVVLESTAGISCRPAGDDSPPLNLPRAADAACANAY